MIGVIPHKRGLLILQRVKDKIKDSEVYQNLCDEYEADLDIIDLIPMAFADLDVSARTEKGCIYFNQALEENELDHYMLHEAVHFFQQCYGDGPTQGSNNSEDYLDNEYEQEGFQAQTEYISETRGDDEAEAYVDKVLDHHDVNKSERNKKKKDLLELAYLTDVYKTAGIIELPDTMKKYLDMVTKTVAGWGLSLDVLQNQPDAIDFATNYAEAPLTKDFVGFTIPVMDLWVDKYMSQANLENITDWPLESGIRVIMSPDMTGEIKEQGLWSMTDDVLNIYLFPDLYTVTDAQSLRMAILNARITLQHEVRHAIQYLMRDLLSPHFGKGPGSGAYKGTTPTTPHFKRDRSVVHPDEFQTYLGDMIAYLKDELQYYDDLDATPAEIFETKKRVFDYFIETASFMKVLKKHDPVKYRKAVTELYKATMSE